MAICQRNIWTLGDVVVDPLTAGSCYFEADDSGHEAKDSTSWLEFSPNMQVWTWIFWTTNSLFFQRFSRRKTVVCCDEHLPKLEMKTSPTWVDERTWRWLWLNWWRALRRWSDVWMNSICRNGSGPYNVRFRQFVCSKIGFYVISFQ